MSLDRARTAACGSFANRAVSAISACVFLISNADHPVSVIEGAAGEETPTAFIASTAETGCGTVAGAAAESGAVPAPTTALWSVTADCSGAGAAINGAAGAIGSSGAPALSGLVPGTVVDACAGVTIAARRASSSAARSPSDWARASTIVTPSAQTTTAVRTRPCQPRPAVTAR